MVTGPPGSGKTHLARTRARSDRAIWLGLRDLHDGTELAARLVGHLRSRIAGLPGWLSAAVTPSGGPVTNSDPLRRAEQVGSLLGQELGVALHRPMTLVIDEMERLDDDPLAMRLVESLVRTAPESLSIVLTTRTGIPFAVHRLRSDDRVLEVGTDELTLDSDHARGLLLDRWPDLDAPAVYTATGGVPGDLLAVGSLLAATDPVERSATLSRVVSAPSGDIAAKALALRYTALTPQQRLLVDELQVLGGATTGELERLGHHDAAKLAPFLLDAMLIEPEPAVGDRLRTTRRAATIIAPDAVIAAQRANDVTRSVAGSGDPLGAISIALNWGTPDLLESAVSRYGAAAIDAGGAQLVLDAISGLPMSNHLRGMAGRAAQSLGDAARACEEYERAAAIEVRISDAWRHGLIEYFRGDVTAAGRVYERGIAAAAPDDEPSDTARLLGYAGAVAWLAGDLDLARDRSRTALDVATAAGDDGALAVAATLAAMVAASDSDRVANDSHYVRALQHAERAADILQIARIRSNRGSRLMEEGEYESALDELDDAVRYAEIGGYDMMLALALTNRGEVTIRLGRLDDARTDLATAVDLLQRQGTAIVAYPLVQLSRLFSIRGDLEQARGAAEQALAITDPSSDRQIHVAALNQVAIALAPLDPDGAWDAARQATAIGEGSLDAAETWTTVGRLAVDRDDFDAGETATARAIEIARSRRDRHALATGLEIHARIQSDVGERRRSLEEAYTLFDELGCPIDAGRVEVAIAAERLDALAVARVAAVADQARRLGARPLLAQAEELLERHDTTTRTVLTVTTLGSFSVALRGETVPIKQWQSKKARDLFKMLVSLRGRPLTRDLAIERLWPDDDPAKASSKLSVALATTRSVLDPDKEFPPEHYVRAEADSIVIDTTTVRADVDQFLAAASSASTELRRTRSDRSVAMLAAVEARYTGDLFEDDPYVDWYVPLREEARAVYLNITRELASIRADSGDLDDAIRLYLRLLEREPYDEPAHLALVSALSEVGRHGDARRRYQHYADRMRELDLEPRSFASTSITPPTR